MSMNVGSIEVICGSMFCGKTEELIRKLVRAKIAKLKVRAYKPLIDDRFNDKDELTSHSGASFLAKRVNGSLEIEDDIGVDTQVVGIDEAQFFDKGIVPLIKKLRKMGIRVIVSGLDMDFKGEPFGPMPAILALAESVEKLKAICHKCDKENASFTQRLVDGKAANYTDPIVVVGASEMYEARCGNHHEVPGDPY